MFSSCFPTFADFVSCCPHPQVFEPQETGCQAALLPLRANCCRREVSDAILLSFGTLRPGDLGGDGRGMMPADEYREALHLLQIHLHRFLRDRDLLDTNAWRVLAMAMAREAIARADEVKDNFVAARGDAAIRLVLDNARTASRQLGRALFRLDNLQQFFLNIGAMRTSSLVAGFDPEGIRDLYAPILELYEHASITHDLLVYELIPAIEARYTPNLVIQPDGVVINLLVVSLGQWVKTGFSTIWSVLAHRTARLRIFVLGDPAGLSAWRAAVEELKEGEHATRFFGVDFEYVDFMAHPRFRAYLRRYPKACSFGEAGQAILARVVCHEWLPPDVDRVISLDLGDLLVLEDIRGLWDFAEELKEHQVLAAGHAVALHHLNGGLVLYNVKRMRNLNFTAATLRAARDGLRRHGDGICLRDQSIINVLHQFREEYGYPGPSPVAALPCRWSVFPTTEWQPHWNTPEMWLPELRKRRRYPGLVSKGHLEIYCPDELDMLSSWAFIPVSEKRQERIRLYAYHEGGKKTRYCSDARPGRGDQRCCACGERAALVHVPGDLKVWRSARNWLAAFMPPWRELPPDDAFATAASKKWQGGDERLEAIYGESEKIAFLTAKSLGLSAVFTNCATVYTRPRSTNSELSLFKLEMPLSLPISLEIETTAEADAHVLVGMDAHTGFELLMGSDGGQSSVLRWVRSNTGWAARGSLYNVPYAAQMTTKKNPSEEFAWTRFTIKLSEAGLFEVTHLGIEWGVPVPADLFEIIKPGPWSVSVGTDRAEARWAVCRGGMQDP
eukprot:TRINITY_DN18040_c0_g1_i1.p1 TRINITY_DN18040_c0_g1~~TRINITY_DN18040_c0_g1_i1.p1  ORF type:complete len:786 (+),score=141.97 TRINITY_DN18040_c0_g1_i1:247-2604(+)